jgi:hypothetical protein
MKCNVPINKQQIRFPSATRFTNKFRYSSLLKCRTGSFAPVWAQRISKSHTAVLADIGTRKADRKIRIAATAEERDKFSVSQLRVWYRDNRSPKTGTQIYD